MHREILSGEQVRLLPTVKQFRREFYLAGGTAVALYIGHRRSVDFVLFKEGKLNNKKIIAKISESGFPVSVTRRVTEQVNMTVGNVKFTFLEYPFKIVAKNSIEDIIRLPELIDLAAMKAYALGQRSKWKDYVDLYFILKSHYSISQISQRASEIFDQLFSEKLFRAQLSYFDDIDYTEPVDYSSSTASEEEIKVYLTDKSVNIGL